MSFQKWSGPPVPLARDWRRPARCSGWGREGRRPGVSGGRRGRVSGRCSPAGGSDASTPPLSPRRGPLPAGDGRRISQFPSPPPSDWAMQLGRHSAYGPVGEELTYPPQSPEVGLHLSMSGDSPEGNPALKGGGGVCSGPLARSWTVYSRLLRVPRDCLRHWALEKLGAGEEHCYFALGTALMSSGEGRWET